MHAFLLRRFSPPPSATGYRCVCTTGTVWHKAEVQSKSQREKLFGDMSWAPFAKGKKIDTLPPPSVPSLFRCDM